MEIKSNFIFFKEEKAIILNYEYINKNENGIKLKVCVNWNDKNYFFLKQKASLILPLFE